MTPSTLESTLRRVAAGSAWILLAATAVQGQLPSGATRLHVSGVECRNLSSGGTVRSTATETEWDCLELGLTVEMGDLVAITVRGRVPREPSAQLLLLGPGGSSVAPRFVESEISDRGDSGFAAADLDLDGDMDLILRDGFRWLEFVTDDPPTFVEHDLPTDGGDPLDVGTLDISGDGRPDIVASHGNGASPNQISWYENVPGDPPVFVERLLYRESGWRPWNLGGGDLDGDGDQDILSWNKQTQGGILQQLVWHENDGGGQSFTAELIYEVQGNPLFSTPINFAVGDLDGDGDLDIFASTLTIEMVWLENDGEPNPSWQLHYVDNDFVPPGLGLGDFDRDGDLDVAAGLQSILVGIEFDELKLYENVDGAFDQIEVHSLGLFSGGFGPRVVDLNADGWLDLFLPSSTFPFDGFHWLENRGSLNFVEHLPLQVDELVPKFDALVVDLGADGDVDVVGWRDVFGADNLTVRVEAEMTVGGWSSALTPDRVRCLNLSTGQSVSISNPVGISFDCEAMGLAVSPEDQVKITIRGIFQ